MTASPAAAARREARAYLPLVVLAAVVAIAPARADESVRAPRAIVYVTDRHNPAPPRVNTELYVMNADGSGQRRLTRNAAQDEQPAWSPDGRTIAFVRIAAGDSAVYVVTSDGTGPHRLSPRTAHHDSGPSWSPDGTRIAFSRGVAGAERAHLWVMQADGSRARQLTRGASSELAPAWSPDGRHITFWSEVSGNVDVYVSRSDGGGRTRITTDPGNDLAPAWSPDGRTIAFNSDRDGGMQLYLMNPDGSNVRAVGFHPSCNEFPSWSPDGRRLAFTSNRDAGGAPDCAGPWEIYVTDLEGSDVHRLTSNAAYDWTSAHSWRPVRH